MSEISFDLFHNLTLQIDVNTNLIHVHTMMPQEQKIPLIALVGLPNAGKSTLMNKMSGTRKAIVANEAHTTRDLNYAEAEWDGMYFRLVDTGGLVPDPKDIIQKQIQIKSWHAISEAEFLIWVIDRKQNPDTISEAIIQKMWKSGKDFVVCINKVDDPNHDKDISDYAKLGGMDFINVSSTNGYGINEILDFVVAELERRGHVRQPIIEVETEHRKKRIGKLKPRAVRRGRDGRYYIVENEDQEDARFKAISLQEDPVINPINNVIFDIHDTVLHPDEEKLFEKLSSIGCTLDFEHFVSLWENRFEEPMKSVWKDEEYGIPFAQYHEQYKAMLYEGELILDEDVEAFIRSHPELNFYYLSNARKEMWDVIKHLEVMKLFKSGVCYYEVSHKKPAPDMYTKLINVNNLVPIETVMFDDIKENIQTARDLGMWGVEWNPFLTDPEEEIIEIQSGRKVRVKAIPQILLLGKPNVGKSSLFNAMVGEQIQIVTEIAGTTLSVNDMNITRTVGDETREYVLLDTTGIRRPGQRTFGAESFATMRTVDAARQADIVCLIIDGTQPLTHQDQVVAGIAHESRRATIIIVNKVDAMDEESKARLMREIGFKFNFLKVDSFIYTSAIEKIGLEEMWNNIDDLLARRDQMIDPDEVRKLFNYLMKKKPPQKLRLKKRAVIYDLVYTKSKPPTFELLVKDKETIHWSYQRFLENIIRKQFNFVGTGIKVKFTEVNKKNVMTK